MAVFTATPSSPVPPAPSAPQVPPVPPWSPALPRHLASIYLTDPVYPEHYTNYSTWYELWFKTKEGKTNHKKNMSQTCCLKKTDLVKPKFFYKHCHKVSHLWPSKKSLKHHQATIGTELTSMQSEGFKWVDFAWWFINRKFGLLPMALPPSCLLKKKTFPFSLFCRPGQSQGLLYKDLCHSLLTSLTHWSFVKISLRRRHALMVEYDAFSHEKDCVEIV